MTVAIRTVSEDENVHVIEGRISYAGPFNGRDTYGTYFSARTDWGLDLHPAGLPVLYNHGFDPDFGLHPIGQTAPPASFRTDEDGIWVQMQLDKRDRYYATRVRPLLDKGALGISQGSAEHSLNIDARTGEVLAWPLHEVSLTPTESNPWNTIAARTGELVTILAARRDMDPNVGGGVDRDKIPAEDFAGPNKSFPIVKPGDVSDAASSLGRAKGDRDAIKAKIIAIAKRKGASYVAELPDAWKDDDSTRTAVRSSSTDAALAASAMQNILYLRDCEAGEADQVALLDAAIGKLSDFIDAELKEPTTDAGDMGLSDAVPGTAYMSAVRKGARNSQKDLTRINAIKQHLADAMAHASALTGDGEDSDDDDKHDASDGDDAARSGEAPTVVTITQREDPVAVRAQLIELAKQVGRDTAKSLTG